MLWQFQVNSQRASAIHTHVSILPQLALPSSLPHNIQQSPLFFSDSFANTEYWEPLLHSRSFSVIYFIYSSVYMSIPISWERRFLTYTLTDKTHRMPKQHTRQPKPKKKQKSHWPNTIPGPVLSPQTLGFLLKITCYLYIRSMIIIIIPNLYFSAIHRAI